MLKDGVPRVVSAQTKTYIIIYLFKNKIKFFIKNVYITSPMTPPPAPPEPPVLFAPPAPPPPPPPPPHPPGVHIKF